MTLADVQAVMRRQRIEIVPREMRTQLAREHDRAHHGCIEADARALELGAHEGVIEPRVVRDEEAPLQSLRQRLRDLAEGRRAVPCIARLEERRPALDAIAIDHDDADLRNAVIGGTQAGRLDVDEGQAVAGSHDRHYRTNVRCQCCTRCPPDAAADTVDSVNPLN